MLYRNRNPTPLGPKFCVLSNDATLDPQKWKLVTLDQNYTSNLVMFATSQKVDVLVKNHGFGRKTCWVKTQTFQNSLTEIISILEWPWSRCYYKNSHRKLKKLFQLGQFSLGWAIFKLFKNTPAPYTHTKNQRTWRTAKTWWCGSTVKYYKRHKRSAVSQRAPAPISGRSLQPRRLW